jgi:hypothetical protein
MDRSDERRRHEGGAPGKTRHAERDEHAEEPPTHGSADAVPRPRARDAPVTEEQQRQRDRDFFGEEGKHVEGRARDEPPAHRPVEGREVEDGGEQCRPRRDVIHGRGVEGMHCHHEGRRGCNRDGFVAEPEVVPYDAEHEDDGEPVQQDVDQVVAPRRIPRDRIVEREARHEERTDDPVQVGGGGGSRVDEEARDVGEAPDARVLLDDVAVIEVEAHARAAGVHDRDRNAEEKHNPPTRGSALGDRGHRPGGDTVGGPGRRLDERRSAALPTHPGTHRCLFRRSPRRENAREPPLVAAAGGS